MVAVHRSTREYFIILTTYVAVGCNVNTTLAPLRPQNKVIDNFHVAKPGKDIFQSSSWSLNCVCHF